MCIEEMSFNERIEFLEKLFEEELTKENLIEDKNEEENAILRSE
jgi:hypothetical protein